MKTWLKLFTVCLLFSVLTVSIQAEGGEPFVFSNTNEDALEGVFFFGESTTAHLARVGGIFDTDAHREKVLRDESGTRYLDRRILSSPVFYNGENVSFAEAVDRARPRVMVLSFGLNGIMRWSRDPEAFLRNYRTLVEGILSRSPNTKILLQSVYPVGENAAFEISKDELNQRIVNLNARISELAKDYENVDYVNTAALLCDENGALNSIYDSGDGIHLKNEAYDVLLRFLCKRIAQIE